MKAVVAAFNQEKALVGAFSVITNLRICFGWNFLKHMRRRKFLYFTTTFEDAWADVATAEFRAKKLELETAVDALFLEKMTAADTKIPLEKGYEGALVISLFRSTPDQLGAGLLTICL